MNKVVIDVEARFTDNVSSGAKSAQKAIDELGKAVDQLQDKLNGMGKKPLDVPKMPSLPSSPGRKPPSAPSQKTPEKKTYKPIFDADNSKFLKKLNDMQRKAERLGHDRTAVTLEAVDHATNVIGKVMNAAQKFGRGAHIATLTIRAVGLNIIHKALSGLRSVAGKAWTATMRVKDFVTAPIEKLKSSLFTVKNLIAAIGAGYVIKKDVGMYKDYENLVTQFSVLLGSQDAAQKRMQDLVTFAGKTPFTRDEIFQASKVLQTYTNGALATPDATGGLTMIGDVAAATGEEFTRVANYFGRLYNEVQRGGNSLGEPLMMLREIGALSADAEEKITDIAQGSGTIDEKWAQIAQQFSKTDGMMEAMSNQLGNLLTGVKAFWKNTAEMTVGEGIAKSLKPFLNDFRTWRSENSALIAEWGARIKDMSQIISGKILGGVEAIASKAQGIMKSPEWDEAGLGGKAKLLWKGLIGDPLTEWWTNGGREKTVAAAGKIGSEAGSLLSKGLTGLFRGIAGLTGKGAGLVEAGTEAGSSVAGAFIDGFLANFDGAAILGAFKDAVSGIWDVMPTWGKALAGIMIGNKLFGAGAKALGGLRRFWGSAGTWETPAGGNGTPVLTGASGLRGLIGRTGEIRMRGGEYVPVGASGLLGFGSKVFNKIHAANPVTATGTNSALASAIGLGTVAGSVTTGLGVVHAGSSLLNANRQYNEGDYVGAKANVVRGVGTLAGAGGGAAAGAMLGAKVGALAGPAGILIGAGVGTAAGWLGSSVIAKRIEATKFETQEMRDAIKDGSMSAQELDATFQRMVNRNLEDHFGDIHLSLDEAARLSEQLVYGDRKTVFDKYTSAAEDARKSLSGLNNAAKQMDRWTWKAKLGVEFSETEAGDIKASVQSLIDSAQGYIENEHYTFTAAVSVLFEPEEPEGQSILDFGGQWYTDLENRVKEKTAELNELWETGLKGDNRLTEQEWTNIVKVQIELADITNEIDEAKEKVNRKLTEGMYQGGRLRMGAGIDYSSYEVLTGQIGADAQTKASTAYSALSDTAYTLQGGLDAAGRTPEAIATYNRGIEAAVAKYNKTVADARKTVLDYGAGMIQETYGSLLTGGSEQILTALDNALSSGVSPAEWSDAELKKAIGVSGKNWNLPGETTDALRRMMTDTYENANPLRGMEQSAIDRMKEPIEPIELEQPVDITPKLEETKPASELFSDEIQDHLGILHANPLEAEQPVDTVLEPGEIDTSQLTENPAEGLLEDRTVEQTFTVNREVVNGSGDSLLSKLGEGLGETVSKTVSEVITVNPEIINGSGDPATLIADTVPDTVSENTSVPISAGYSVSPKLTDARVKQLAGVKSSYSASATLHLTLNVATSVAGGAVGAVAQSYTKRFGAFRGGIFGGSSSMSGFARGGLIDTRSVQRFSDGGMVRGGSRLIQVAEEGSPEMVIPLSSQRRERGRKLWEKAGEMLKVPGFARGGLVDRFPDSAADVLSLPNVWQTSLVSRSDSLSERAFSSIIPRHDEEPIPIRNSNWRGIPYNSPEEIMRPSGNNTSTASADIRGVDVGGVTIQNVNLTIHVDGGNSDVVSEIKSHRGELVDMVAEALTEALETGFANTPLRGGLAL